LQKRQRAQKRAKRRDKSAAPGLDRESRRHPEFATVLK